MTKFGIIGAGDIANAMAKTISNMSDVDMYAIASRNLDKAESYKEKYKMKKAYDSYEELVRDDNINVVYIATPHSFHYEHAMLCLKHGKHVLCEKAFTANARQAKELIEYARAKNLFLGEAMWTRFMPLTKKFQQLLQEKIIGEVTYMTANLNFPMMQKERLLEPELAGGALLDVGIYPLTIASLVMGDDIQNINVSVRLSDQGMDIVGQYTLLYKDGRMADLNSGMCSFSDGNAVIYGTKGFMVLEGVNHPYSIKVYDSNKVIFQEIQREHQITGYEYEVRACVEAIKNKQLFCEEISHEQTMIMMRQMDKIRQLMGVKYPFE